MYRNSKMQWLSWNDVTKPKLIKTLRIDFLQATQYFFFGKINDQHDQWSVLNLLTYNLGMKDNFEQGGIVSVTRAPLAGGRFWPPPPPPPLLKTPVLIGAARRAMRRLKALNKKILMHI